MDINKIVDHIVNWLTDKIKTSNQKGFVLGVSGGIDSAVVSTLSAMTGYPVTVLNMPILQVKDQYNRSDEQIDWLKSKFDNVKSFTVELTNPFQELIKVLPDTATEELALVNTRSRMRMVALYSFANSNNYLVAGTGNKVEDYGIGFFTKYGDGGVDISPIGELLKSEVYEVAKYLGVPESIQKAAPTDGLWGKDRTDEEQIGATYDEIEWAMHHCDLNNINSIQNIDNDTKLSDRQLKVLEIYLHRHNSTQHKLIMPPVCDLSTVR